MVRKSKRNSYSSEFKRKAVLMTLKNGVKVTDVADELGVASQHLSRWRADFRKARKIEENVDQIDAIEENMHLKAEIKQLKMDNEILKNAASYFASRK
jgi:transposase